ncbi:fungal-specific transcription factor domain-containing protein [Xylogone sp. PMI_703]|nr:fungal-specific transcription factor domain-containing protein [Xylogone sp. PMI_703]
MKAMTPIARTSGTADGDSPSQSRPLKRARSAIACQRCKHRKQRCDNAFPSCTNCTSAGEGDNCVYGGAGNAVYSPEYVASLESHIANLEQRLRSRELGHVQAQPLQSELQEQTQDYTALREQTVEASKSQTNQTPVQDTATGYSNISQNGRNRGVGQLLEVGTGFVALSSSAYLGESSGTPLAKIIQSAVVLGSNNDVGGDTAISKPGISATMDDALGNSNIEMPNSIVADKLIEAYITKVHSKHPFMSRAKLRQMNERRHELKSFSNLPKDQQSSLDCRLDFFMIHMIYAIGARYLQLSRDSNHVSPEAHYAAAIQDIDTVFDVQSIENLQCMLLLALYQLRSPSGPGLWSMIGLVMRHCLDSGLHRKSHLPVLVDQRRKRLFWTVYMLERSVARTLGRPCCVTDREIDIDLPANVSDDIETEEGLTAAIEHASRYPNQVTSISPAIHIICVQRLESKIHRTVYRVDKPLSAIQPHKISRLRAELEEWKNDIANAIPPPSENETVPYNMADYHMIQYHKGTLLLLLPFLPNLGPLDPDFRLCAFAAGQICQLYKRLHDKQQYISFSLLALHATFVAGLAMIYCFSIDRSIFDSRFSSDIRACSTVLYVIAERWPAVRKVRSAFETLVAATVESGSTARPQAANNELLLSSSTPIQHERNNFPQLPTPGSACDGDNMAPMDVWDLFETVLDEKDHGFRWAQEGFFNAMNAFPEYGWTL